MRKNRFFGKYYKSIADDGFTIAFIVSTANEGDMCQLVTPSKAYVLKDPKQVEVKEDMILFNIEQDDLKASGELIFTDLHPLNKKVMGPFSYFPMQCVHEIYSMYHKVNGRMLLNGKEYRFTNSRGYIEGDSGTSFPSKYIWYNSLLDNQTITLAVATIPFLGFIHFTGLLCFIKTDDLELRMCTYNRGKIISKSDKEIVIKKGKYRLMINIHNDGGHNLKAPTKGNMIRYIKESINCHTSYKLTKDDEVILEGDDPLSSFEYMY